MFDLTTAEAIQKAKHLAALGQTVDYVRDADGFPFDKVSKVESGSSYRLYGPSSCYVIAQTAGLTLKLNVDFEGRDANGRGVSHFDRDRLRDLALRLPREARQQFAQMLETECLPGMAKRTNELRSAMRDQADSEDCVRGLIAFASERVSA